MPACTCKNCGHLNVLVGGMPPPKLKCEMCGNTFNTSGAYGGGLDEDLGAAYVRQQLNEIDEIGRKQRSGDIAGFLLYAVSVAIAFFAFTSSGNGYVASFFKAIVWPFVLIYNIYTS